MSPIRINRRRAKARPARVSSSKPVSLPTFSFYGHLPVIFADGELVIGRRVIRLERRR